MPKNRSKLTLELVRKALIKSNGNLTAASKALQVGRDCLYDWLKREPSLRVIREEAGERLLDTAEDKIRRAVERGEPWAVRFTLARKGRERGWGNSLAVTTDGGHGSLVVIAKGDPSQAEIDEAIEKQSAGSDVTFVLTLPDDGRNPPSNRTSN